MPTRSLEARVEVVVVVVVGGGGGGGVGVCGRPLGGVRGKFQFPQQKVGGGEFTFQTNIEQTISE